MKYKKGTFVIVPNMHILHGKSPELQTVFLWLCSYIDENGQCFPSRKKLAECCSMTVKTLDKYMTALTDLGLVTKTQRQKEGTVENMSNLYQVNVLDTLPSVFSGDYPSVNEDPTPREPNDPVTIPNTNYTQLTILTLPLSRGNTPIKRILSIYGTLWYQKYGYYQKVNFGVFTKKVSELLKQHSELQIALYLTTYFNWYGVSGNSEKEYKFVLESTFPITLFCSMINKFELYQRNVRKVDVDDPQTVYREVQDYFKSN